VHGAGLFDVELDDIALAHYFSFQIPVDGRTLFKNIFELLPAHRMFIGENGIRLENYWKPDPTARTRYKTDDEYAEHFLALLNESVSCRLRTTTPIGVQMSGGLDSTSVACLAAQILYPKVVHAISYVFDDLVSCDERYYINSLKSYKNIEFTQFNGDALWPYKDWRSWPRNSNGPDMMPYRLLLREVQEHARQKGIRVLLTGSFGDYLYQGGRAYWLADVLVDNGILKASSEAMKFIHEFGVRRIWQDDCLKQAILKRMNISFEKLKRNGQPAWLTPFAIDILNERQNIGYGPVFNRHASVGTFGLLAARISTHEIPFANSLGLELRHPYRDRRLIEFVLSLPAYQLFYKGLPKFILRNAMRGILPEPIIARRQPTSLFPLYNKGVGKENGIFGMIYEKDVSLWKKFIRRNELMKIWQSGSQYESTSAGLIPWLCIAVEKWREDVPVINMDI